MQNKIESVDDLITIKNAAIILDRTERRVYQHIKAGKLDRYKKQNRSFVPKRQVLRLLEPCKVT